LQLALKMKLRDPGSAPEPGSRVPYIFKVVKEYKDMKQAVRLEDPDYIKDHQEENIKLDYGYYCESQIEKPILDLFSTVMDDADDLFRDAKRDYMNIKNGNQDLSNFFKLPEIKRKDNDETI